MAFSIARLFGKKEDDSKEYKEQYGSNTEEENKLLDIAKHRFETARSQKVDHTGRPLNDKFRDLDKIYRGDQWKETTKPHKSQPVLNFTFSLVESIVPRVVDHNPEISVLSRREGPHDALADMLDSIQDHLWYTNKMKRQTQEAVRMAMKYGTALWKVIWDEFMYDDLGDVRYGIIHPMNFYPDPRAYTIEDMDYCFVAVPKPLEYFYRKFPEKADCIRSDMEWHETENVEGAGNDTGEPVAFLKEYWFKDESGNTCVMYYVQNVVLKIIGGQWDKDKPDSPVYKHNKFPFVRFVDYPADKEFWGIGEVELVTLVQRLINSFEAQIIDNTRLMANAQWIINKVQSGLKEEDSWILDDRPGGVIWTYNGGVEKSPGTPLPAHIPAHQERLIFSMEQILGVHDVVQGRRPSGVRAASAIIALQESANIRVRMKADNMEEALRDMAELSNWLILEFYDEPRRIRLSGHETKYITLNVREALTERIFETAQDDGLVMPDTAPADYSDLQLDELREEVSFPEFDVEVKVGPSVPYSQALLYEQAKEFFSLGIIDRRAVLEATNFPGREEILKRIEAQEQAQQAEEQQLLEQQMAEQQQMGGQETPIM